MVNGDGFPPEIAGEVGTGSGLPLLWAHGLTSSRAAEDAAGLFTWSPPGPLVRWDAPGHGASRPLRRPEDATWPRLADIMLAVADGHGAEQFIAGGASMGTATSLWAAVTAPERVKALFLVIPPTAWETRAAQTHVYLERAAMVEEKGTAALAEAMEAEPVPALFAPVAETMKASRREATLAADPANLAKVLRGAAASDLPDRDRIRSLRVPSLILAWEGDGGHPVTTAAALSELLGDSELHVASQLRDVLNWRHVADEWLAKVGD
ncbi:MAG TPA: alpha/beta fold hydrolase [Acidimicrobiales bacterium]|nr:alpha/beta fold hydrolase [Acidimicrobiales bacterium]